MKIISWNCNGAFRKKYGYLDEFDSDILVIQECEDPRRSTDKNYKNWANNCLWLGDNKNKGLGIFAKSHIEITPLNWENDRLKYFIPCKIENDFNLIATWCHGANSPTFGYIGQMWKYLQLHKTKFKKCVIAGDFNSNVIWDKWDRWWNHSDVLRELENQDIISFYHKFFLEDQGTESRPTLYLQKNINKPYHIDYIFGSNEIAERVIALDIGNATKWLDKSDHMPLICEFT